MFSIEVLGRCEGDEELTPISKPPLETMRLDNVLLVLRVRSAIGHTENATTVVTPFEPFVVELRPIDGLSSSSILVRDISALQHEAGNEAVEDVAAVAEEASRALGEALGACAELPEVMRGPGRVHVVELQHQTPDYVPAHLQLKEATTTRPHHAEKNGETPCTAPHRTAHAAFDRGVGSPEGG